MVSAKEAPTSQLIHNLSKKLKHNNDMKPPEWAHYVKTGVHAERKPEQPDWWYTRCASIMRKLYIQKQAGVGGLRTWYGGRKNRGSKPEKHKPASGHVIRTALQQLEKAGYVKKQKTGRILTPQGRALIDKTVNEINPKKQTKPAPKTETKPTKKADQKPEVKKHGRTGTTKATKTPRTPKKHARKSSTKRTTKSSRTTKTSTPKKTTRTKSKRKTRKN